MTRVRQWLAQRPPWTILLAAWVVFLLGCYPGFLSFDSVIQLGEVRARSYSSAYAPLMTALWAAAEYVLTGPLPMVLVQSGLVLLATASLLRRVTTPRVAALAAGLVLVFPPVAAPLAVVWRDSLLAGCLLGATAAALSATAATGRARWLRTAVALALAVLACSCRPAAVIGLVPLAWWVMPEGLARARFRRIAASVGVALVLATCARIGDRLAIDREAYAFEQDVQLADLVATLRRADVHDPAALERAFAGVPLGAPGELEARVRATHKRVDGFALAHGDGRIVEPITTEVAASAVSAAWWRVITAYPGAYLGSRWRVTRALLGTAGPFDAVYDGFGDPDLLAPLAHRARASDWEHASRAVVHGLAKTPLFRPWFYLLVALALLLGIGRASPAVRMPVRVLVASGLVHELVMAVVAPSPDYRYSHWLVVATCVAGALALVARRWPPAADPEPVLPRARVTWSTFWTPRAVLVAAECTFLAYCFPGFVGWDTREHFVNERSGVYLDGHPPAVARLFRLCELFVAGPALLIILQSTLLLLGLYAILRRAVPERTAAVLAAAIVLFPPISGVTGLVGKDPLMEGCILLGIGALLDPRMRAHRFALLWVAAATLMRWNALAATAAPMTLMFRATPTIAGWRRYAVAILAWLAITLGAFEANELLRTKHEYLWFGSHAYQDIAGTLEYMPDQSDAELQRLLAGVPLRTHANLHAQLRARYNPADYRHLAWGPDRLLDIPHDEAERTAVGRAWREIVLGHPAAYLRYRVDNYRLLNRLDRPPSFSNVYVWFHVIAAPETVPELEHDAAPSHLQSWLVRAQIWIGWTPLYFIFLYFGLCVALAPVVRTRLEASMLLSAFGYHLAWFFLAPTTDFRYSQWLMICSLTVLALVITRRRSRGRS